MSDPKTWEKSIKDVIKLCQSELKKTTAIGKKMLMASRINSSLSETYRQLGILTYKEIQSGRLFWENDKVQKLCKKLAIYLDDLEKAEADVSSIKSSKKSKE